MGADKAVLLEKSAGVNMSPGKNNDKILTNTLWTQNGTVYISINGKQTALSGVNYNDFCPYYYVKNPPRREDFFLYDEIKISLKKNFQHTFKIFSGKKWLQDPKFTAVFHKKKKIFDETCFFALFFP